MSRGCELLISRRGFTAHAAANWRGRRGPPLPLARPPEFVVCPLMREIRAFRYFWRRRRLFLPFPALGDHSRRRLDIDGLRALAVGAVLVFHAFPYRLPGGHAGVDVFFVISGFVITGT